jgi:two-component system sensor histidine kinase/response regulator
MARMILVADDEKLSRMCTGRILESLGFEVVSVEDGRLAVEAEAVGHFDAIVMDCQMPRLDGFQATAAIRRRQLDTCSPIIPIIGLSARAMDGDREAALSRGMDEYVTKPVRVHKLQAALEHVGVRIPRVHVG